MKLIEKMGIDLNTVEGITKLKYLYCEDMPCYGTCNYRIEGRFVGNVRDLEKCFAEHLLAEVPTKKRLELYKETLFNAKKDFFNKNGFTTTDSCIRDDNDMAQFAVSCFVDWLMEDVEVEI